MYDGLNKGAKMAHGDLVGQINTDDWYESDAVENMVKLYEKTHYDVAWGSLYMRSWDKNGNAKKPWIKKAHILAGGTWIWRMACARKKENVIMKEGMLALLHDRIFKACTFYIEQGWCSVEARHNLECLFKPYSDLGGDGTAESLYQKCMDLPLSEDGGN